MRLLFVLLILVSWQAHSRGELRNLPAKPTEAEMKSLPYYCWVKMYLPMNSAEYQKWNSNLGKDFVHTHHFCMGMNYANRSFRMRDPLDQEDARKLAYTNFQYMIDHADQKYVLMPEVYMQRGRLYMSSGKGGNALTDFEKAVNLKPDLIDGYLAQAKFYEKVGKKEEALIVIKRGLEKVPKSETLKKRHYELGGGEFLSNDESILDEKKGEDEKGDDNVDVKITNSPEENIDRTQEAIGNLSNPWCRFCVDLPTK